MNLKLTVYEDDSYSNVKRTAEADELVVPYKVAMWALENIDELDLKDGASVMRFVSSNTDKIEKILKATFKVTNSELECVNAMEVIKTVKELYSWVMDKVNDLGGNEKN